MNTAFLTALWAQYSHNTNHLTFNQPVNSKTIAVFLYSEKSEKRKSTVFLKFTFFEQVYKKSVNHGFFRKLLC